MKSKHIQNLLRLLITLLGAGVGAAAFMGLVQLGRLTNPGLEPTLGILVLGYIGLMALGAGVCFLCSRRILQFFTEVGSYFERKMDEMSLGQLVASSTGLILGLIIAALLSQILRFMGDSMFTTVMACIIFVVFGVLGLSMGYHRAKEVDELLKRGSVPRLGRFMRKRTSHKKLKKRAQPRKLLDTSALIDGRILPVYQAGFLEGEMAVPDFILDELRHIADAADGQKRARGRRGLEVLEKLKSICPVQVPETPPEDDVDADVRLMRLARKNGDAILTCDYSLTRAAQVAGVRALNLNELAGALRPVVQAGDELQVTITKEGKEPGQGVAYMEDGTMVVVEGGRRHLEKTITVVVTTALQTSAGRMIFAKPRPMSESKNEAV